MSASTGVATETEAAWLTPRDLTFLVVINLIWGFNFITSKIGVQQFPPMFFTALRFALLALLLSPLLKIFRGQMKWVITAALCSGAAQFALLFLGIRLAKDVSTAAVAGQLGVPFTTLLSVWLLGETIRWRRKLGIALSFGGVLLMGFEPRVFDYWPALVLVVASSFAGSLGLIFIKRLEGVKPMQLQAWIAVVSFPVLVLLSLLLEHGQIDALHGADLRGWGALAFASIMSSLVAHSGIFYLIGRYPVTSVAPLLLLSPLFGIFFGVTLLHDMFTARMWLGGLITLTGVFIVAAREKKIVDTGS